MRASGPDFDVWHLSEKPYLPMPINTALEARDSGEESMIMVSYPLMQLRILFYFIFFFSCIFFFSL